MTSCGLIRLDLAESIRAPTRGPRRNPFETALAEAERQEAESGPPAELPFSATILCVGITGVGKTATIHSVLGLPPPAMGSFEPETKQVRTPLRLPDPIIFPFPRMRGQAGASGSRELQLAL